MKTVFNHIQKKDDLEELKQQNEYLKNKIAEIVKILCEKDKMIENIINSMMGKFQKLKEWLFELESSEENQGEITFCNPSSLEKHCIDITEDEIETNEAHTANINLKDGSLNETSEKEIVKPAVETFKCDLCEFRTPHNQGLKSQMTKMHGVKNQNFQLERK